MADQFELADFKIRYVETFKESPPVIGYTEDDALDEMKKAVESGVPMLGADEFYENIPGNAEI